MDFLQTLAAVVIGGAIAMAGSVLVNRRAATREQRIILHLNVLPMMVPPLVRGDRDSKFTQECVKEVQQHAIAAGKSDRKRVNRADADVQLALRLQDEYTHLRSNQPADMDRDTWQGECDRIEAERTAAVQRVGQTLDDYQTWLHGQLGHWL